eukprot:6990-Heterococcus_DN1.PRE.1
MGGRSSSRGVAMVLRCLRQEHQRASYCNYSGSSSSSSSIAVVLRNYENQSMQHMRLIFLCNKLSHPGRNRFFFRFCENLLDHSTQLARPQAGTLSASFEGMQTQARISAMHDFLAHCHKESRAKRRPGSNLACN